MEGSELSVRITRQSWRVLGFKHAIKPLSSSNPSLSHHLNSSSPLSRTIENQSQSQGSDNLNTNQELTTSSSRSNNLSLSDIKHLKHLNHNHNSHHSFSSVNPPTLPLVNTREYHSRKNLTMDWWYLLKLTIAKTARVRTPLRKWYCSRLPDWKTRNHPSRVSLRMNNPLHHRIEIDWCHLSSKLAKTLEPKLRKIFESSIARRSWRTRSS